MGVSSNEDPLFIPRIHCNPYYKITTLNKAHTYLLESPYISTNLEKPILKCKNTNKQSRHGFARQFSSCRMPCILRRNFMN